MSNVTLIKRTKTKHSDDMLDVVYTMVLSKWAHSHKCNLTTVLNSMTYSDIAKAMVEEGVDLETASTFIQRVMSEDYIPLLDRSLRADRQLKQISKDEADMRRFYHLT